MKYELLRLLLWVLMFLPSIVVAVLIVVVLIDDWRCGR